MIYYITKYSIIHGAEKGDWVFLEEKLNHEEFSKNDKFINLIKINLEPSFKEKINNNGSIRFKEKEFLKLL